MDHISETQGTYFAPAQRKTFEEVMGEYLMVSGDHKVAAILEALPVAAAVLNQERQFVYVNQQMLDTLNLPDARYLHPLRLGEALGCIHSHEEEGGCGTSESCRYCGAVQAMLKSQNQKALIKGEVRLTTEGPNGQQSHDLTISSAPYYIQDQEFLFLTVMDIGDQKRRRNLERIFFHDIINTAGGLSGYLDMLTSFEDQEEIFEGIDMAKDISHSLLDSIQAQRQLLAAEQGELAVSSEEVSSLDTIRLVTNEIKYHPIAAGRDLMISPDSVQLELKTDPVLLNRILLNMVKNALEAERPQASVMVGCRRTHTGIQFWVHNPSHIPRKAQLQIFQRSFSTKGTNRGLGTYSMKLLGERYLGGEVGFDTDPEKGTVFYLVLPT